MDFLLTNDREPLVLVEANLADEQPSKALLAIQRSLRIPAVQLVRRAEGYRTLHHGSMPLLIAPAYAWLAGLPA